MAAIEDLLTVEPAISRTIQAIGRLRRFGCLLLDNSERFIAPRLKTVERPYHALASRSVLIDGQLLILRSKGSTLDSALMKENI
jgi:hypothetical protein